jgi:hypothetical protein
MRVVTADVAMVLQVYALLLRRNYQTTVGQITSIVRAMTDHSDAVSTAVVNLGRSVRHLDTLST